MTSDRRREAVRHARRPSLPAKFNWINAAHMRRKDTT
jgi:hypothetical protein